MCDCESCQVLNAISLGVGMKSEYLVFLRFMDRKTIEIAQNAGISQSAICHWLLEKGKLAGKINDNVGQYARRTNNKGDNNEI